MTTQPCLQFNQHLPELPASQIRHCPQCGARSAWLLVSGERSQQYACRCGHVFELDRPRAEPAVPFRTRARLLFDINQQVGR